MTALSDNIERELLAPGPPMKTYNAAASIAFKQGSMVGVDTADGLLKRATASTTLNIVGVSCRELDTTGLDAADRKIPVDHGTHGWFQSATGGGDDIAADDETKLCYAVDDDTVALTNGGGTRSVAGRIYEVDDDGRVAVQFEVIR